jgi:hypothetical protein
VRESLFLHSFTRSYLNKRYTMQRNFRVSIMKSREVSLLKAGASAATVDVENSPLEPEALGGASYAFGC